MEPFSLAKEPPTYPWRMVAAAPLEGALECGFVRAADRLLVLSSRGRVLFDCVTGALMTENGTEARPGVGWWDSPNLRCRGIGRDALEWVRMAGIWGGGLSRQTEDGWRLEHLQVGVFTDWQVALCPPGSNLAQPERRKGCVELELPGRADPLAIGFSPTGRSLVYLDRNELFMWSRQML